MLKEIEAEQGLNDLIEAREKADFQRAIRLLDAVRNIESLTLSVWMLTFAFHRLSVRESLSLQFHNLKYLKLKTWLSRDCIHSILHLLKISPYVETLSIEILKDDDPFQQGLIRRNEFQELDSSKQCIFAHLRYLDVRGAIGLINELEVDLIGNVLRSAIPLKILNIWPDKENEYDVADRKDQIYIFTMMLRSIPPASSKLSIAFM